MSLAFDRRLPGFLRARALGDDATRLLNVALTRVRRHLILVANMDYLTAQHDEAPILVDQAITTYIDRRNEHPTPFVWTATVQKILKKVNEANKTLATLH